MNFVPIDIGCIEDHKHIYLQQITYTNNRALNISLTIVNAKEIYFDVFIIFQGPFSYRVSDEASAIQLGNWLGNLPRSTILGELKPESDLLNWASIQSPSVKNKAFLVFTENEFIEIVSAEAPTCVVLPS